MKGWSVIRQGVIGPTSFQFEKASPFRPRIARGQCDAIATGRYIYILADGRSRICRLTGQGPPLLIKAGIGRMSRSWRELDTPGWREWRE